MIEQAVVVVMAKFPTAGRVKTRLGPELSPEQCAAVQRSLLVHTVRNVHSLAAAAVVAFDPADAVDAFRILLAGSGLPTADLVPQGEGDLGRRLAQVHQHLRPSHPRVLYIGVDSPDLPADHLTHAARLLYQAQVVLGPTPDGGYWCLGLDASVDAAALLAQIEWSSGCEAQQTIASAHRLGYSLALADEWDDVDRYDDLRRLMERLAQSKAQEDRALLHALRAAAPPLT